MTKMRKNLLLLFAAGAIGGCGGDRVRVPVIAKDPCKCGHGFHCAKQADGDEICVLNGDDGPLQITLRWSDPQDLDLHVIEPLPDGGSCEIYYLDRGQPSSCGALGLLDLDSNASCKIDNLDAENVIYPPTKPAPAGTYKVLVDFFKHCSGTDPIPYELTVRVHTTSTVHKGVFQPTDSDKGGQQGGVVVATFDVP